MQIKLTESNSSRHNDTETEALQKICHMRGTGGCLDSLQREMQLWSVTDPLGSVQPTLMLAITTYKDSAKWASNIIHLPLIFNVLTPGEKRPVVQIN